MRPSDVPPSSHAAPDALRDEWTWYFVRSRLTMGGLHYLCVCSARFLAQHQLLALVHALRRPGPVPIPRGGVLRAPATDLR